MHSFLAFLVQTAVLLLVVGVPTAALWLRSKRKTSLRTCYFLAFGHIGKWFGLAFSSVAALIFGFALTDQLSLTHFGYPFWTLIVTVMAVLCGFGIRWLAVKWIGWVNNDHQLGAAPKN